MENSFSLFWCLAIVCYAHTYLYSDTFNFKVKFTRTHTKIELDYV